MTEPSLKLVLFDVDGTLADSQGAIVASATAAFEAVGQPVPERQVILSIVGLSLERAMATLTPELDAAVHTQMADAYRSHYADQRQLHGAEGMPLYPGAVEMLEHLASRPEVLLGVATGKSRRGLDALIEAHDLARFFVTRQVADDHPSKPHPSMILTAMAETGVEPADTVMIGDTQFDIEMAVAAGVPALGVSWGYHPVEALHQSHAVLNSFDELPGRLSMIWGERP